MKNIFLIVIDSSSYVAVFCVCDFWYIAAISDKCGEIHLKGIYGSL